METEQHRNITMESRQLPFPYLPAYLLKQYATIRIELLWKKFWGKAGSGVKMLMGKETDPTVKIQECNQLIKDIYSTNKFVIPDSYLLYIDDKNPDELKQTLINNFIQQVPFYSAFLFIVKDKSLSRISVSIENKTIIKNEEEIVLKEGSYKSSYPMETLIKQLMEKDQTKNQWRLLTKTEVNLLVENTNHNHTKILNAFIEFILDLGEKGLNQLFMTEIKHAIRTFFISVVMASVLQKEFESYLEKELAELNTLEMDVKKVLDKIDDLKDKDKIDDITKEEKNLAKARLPYRKKLYQLCLLDAPGTIRKANDEGLFREMRSPRTIEFSFSDNLKLNPYKPFAFQKDCHLLLLQLNCDKIEKGDIDSKIKANMTLSFKELEKIPFTLPIEPIIIPNMYQLPSFVENIASSTSNMLCDTIGHVPSAIGYVGGGVFQGVSKLINKFGFMGQDNNLNTEILSNSTPNDNDLDLISSRYPNTSK